MRLGVAAVSGNFDRDALHSVLQAFQPPFHSADPLDQGLLSFDDQVQLMLNIFLHYPHSMIDRPDNFIFEIGQQSDQLLVIDSHSIPTIIRFLLVNQSARHANASDPWVGPSQPTVFATQSTKKDRHFGLKSPISPSKSRPSLARSLRSLKTQSRKERPDPETICNHQAFSPKNQPVTLIFPAWVDNLNDLGEKRSIRAVESNYETRRELNKPHVLPESWL
jgi:hypothetical protein